MGSLVIANDNEPVDDYAVAANDLVLPPDVCRMLDDCDRVRISMDMLMTICRSQLHTLGADQAGITETVLSAFRAMIERRR